MRFPRLSWASFVLAAAGVAVAIYLVYVHYQEHALVCGLGNCEKVQTSKYAELAGIPIAWMGLAMYLVIAVLLIARELRADLLDLTTVGLLG
ncbi:MAG TPA: vitamin K epoxide reductase family protein, partial [Thermomicrobiales bacterium]|nr:vitamin K epoxide reductase family protein [Thermomicrobiales bacterium]